MPIAERSRVVAEQAQLEEVLELVRAARGGSVERTVLASTLKLLAAWLDEQARLLSAEHTNSLTQVARHVHGGPHTRRLTRRERQIAVLVARGLSNREIGEHLVIATSTTERHVANILSKLGMRSRAQVAAWAVQNAL